MSKERFSRREVERSFRKFDDIVSDLFQATFQTWGNVFTHLITHCEHDPVMQVVTAPLKKNKHVDAEKWFKAARESTSSMVGSGQYELPYDDEDRTALLYQFFLLIEYKDVDWMGFCMDMYGTTQFQEMVDTFNRELVRKFTRELSYRLNEILQDVAGQQDVPKEAMIVFHHHDHSTHIQGTIQGSNIATGHATVSQSSATYSTADDLAEALMALRPLVDELNPADRPAVDAAVQVVVGAAHDPSVGVDRVAEASRIIAEKSPSMGQRLKGIAGKVGISLISSAIVQGIKSGIGL